MSVLTHNNQVITYHGNSPTITIITIYDYIAPTVCSALYSILKDTGSYNKIQ